VYISLRRASGDERRLQDAPNRIFPPTKARTRARAGAPPLSVIYGVYTHSVAEDDAELIVIFPRERAGNSNPPLTRGAVAVRTCARTCGLLGYRYHLGALYRSSKTWRAVA